MIQNVSKYILIQMSLSYMSDKNFFCEYTQTEVSEEISRRLESELKKTTIKKKTNILKGGCNTLLIFGTYQIKGGLIFYDVSIYGQTDSEPVVIYIKDIQISTINYHYMINKCKDAYFKYFNVSDVHLITLDKLIEIKNH